MKPRPAASLRRLFVLALLFIGAIDSGSSAILRPLNVEELTRKAGDIVIGTCLSVRDGALSPNHPRTVRVTIRVDRRLKGHGGSVLVFDTLSPEDDDGVPAGVGPPRFHAGEDVLLFLYPESRSGFRSPVGFGHGKFTRLVQKDGEEIAVNQLGNRHLFEHLSAEGEKAVGKRHDPGRKDSRLRTSDLIGIVEGLAP